MVPGGPLPGRARRHRRPDRDRHEHPGLGGGAGARPIRSSRAIRKSTRRRRGTRASTAPASSTAGTPTPTATGRPSGRCPRRSTPTPPAGWWSRSTSTPSRATPARCCAEGAFDRDQVAYLQQTLEYLGYELGTADGDFGDRTHDAVVRFQRDKGLNDNGVVDDATWTALDRSRGS